MLKFAIIALVFVVGVLPARAAEIDFSAVLHDAAGSEMKDCDHVNQDDPKVPFCDKYVPMTLSRVSAAAVDQIDQGVKAEDIVIRGQLAIKLRRSASGKIDLDQRDIDLIKAQVAKMRLPPSAIAEVFDLLSPKARN
jgi:hypothetical protein